MSNWEHFSVYIYICDDPRSQKYGHIGRASKIRKMENVSIVQYTRVQCSVADSCHQLSMRTWIQTLDGTVYLR